MPDQRIEHIADLLRQFARERDWDQFHSPKNLACGLCIEAAELLEHFQWMQDDKSTTLPEETRQKVGEELADVFLYLIQISDKLGIDLTEVAHRKLILNGEKYPVNLSKGTSKKYTEF
jgi:dCTP diphosphatase